MDYSIIYSLSLEDISKLNDISLKKEIVHLQMNELETYKKYSCILKDINIYELYIKNINQILRQEITDCKLNFGIITETIDIKLTKYVSYDYFPNHKVVLYPTIKKLKSTKLIKCNICGSAIFPNSHYLSYRPLLNDLDSSKVYVLKNTIKCETSYYDILPKDIFAFEEFNRKLNDEYYDISTNLKTDSLNLLTLKK